MRRVHDVKRKERERSKNEEDSLALGIIKCVKRSVERLIVISSEMDMHKYTHVRHKKKV